MAPSTIIGISGVLVGVTSTLATLYVARRGGSFRRRSLIVRFGGCPLINGKALTVVYGVPGVRTLALATLPLELCNPGGETVEDIAVTVVLPEVLGHFFDEKTKTPNIEFVVSRGVDPGTSTKIEKVGIYHHLHLMVKSLHPLVTMGLDMLVGFPGATRQTFDVPVTFKDGVAAKLQVQTFFVMPINIFLIAKNRDTQHFTINLELYAPTEYGFRPLMGEWLGKTFSQVRKLKSLRSKVTFWLPIITGFQRCFLVALKYEETVHEDAPPGKKEKKGKTRQIKLLQEVPGTRHYATGYLLSAFAFYRLFQRKGLGK